MAKRESNNGGERLVKDLIERGDYELAFTEAARWGERELVNKFLAEGVDVNWQGADGVNALMKASLAGEYQIVETLLAHGADVNAKSQRSRTALHFSVSALVSEGKSKKTAMLLISAGADIHYINDNGYTPADLARQRYSQEYVDLLSSK